MIDSFVVLHIGGALLFCWNQIQSISYKKAAVNSLIQKVLLEKKDDNPYYTNDNALYYQRTYNPDLVFILICERRATILYAEDMLSVLSKEFLSRYANAILSDMSALLTSPLDFSHTFETVYDLFRVKTKPTPTPIHLTTSLPPASPISAPSSPMEVLEKKSEEKKSKEAKTMSADLKADKSKKKGGKKLRSKKGAIEFDENVLDFSADKPIDTSSPSMTANASSSRPMQLGQLKVEKKKSNLGIFSSLIGGTITQQSLDKVLPKFKEQLIDKNVAADVATRVIESVESDLIGKSAPKLGGIQSLVKSSLSQSISQILTPTRHIDILQEVKDHKAKNSTPYSIVFCGVNGVGKSTNLAKIAFYLKQHGIKILIAGCDTFRSGAVQQLEVHAKRLDIELFAKDYGTSPASVASSALNYANRKGFDCVLIDTAGRMQDNEPLMAALAELVSRAVPNLVLFVGEALVGHSSVDQIERFEAALLKKVTGPRNGVGIDGIFLTKFDTVDTKVGSALSLCFISGKPIVYIGTGQNYTDLVVINAEAVVEALLSS
ncbi:hypothetical protein P9112_010455 [Eukaryota sp. TZLM1-RC]